MATKTKVEVEIAASHTDEFGAKQEDVLTLKDFDWSRHGVIDRIAEGLCIDSLRIYRGGVLELESGEWDDLDAREEFLTAAADRYLL